MFLLPTLSPQDYFNISLINRKQNTINNIHKWWMEMAIPRHGKIIHLHRCIFSTSPEWRMRWKTFLTWLLHWLLLGVLWWIPPGSHLLHSSSTCLEYTYSTSEEASATYTLAPMILRNPLFHLHERANGKTSMLWLCNPIGHFHH